MSESSVYAPTAAEPLRGSLDHLSLPDLLQTLEASKRNAEVTVRSDRGVARLWLRHGRLIDAEIDGGPRGLEAVFTALEWGRGTFESHTDENPRSATILQSTSAVLLSAAAARDEAARRERPQHAGLPDPPPPPPRILLARHRSVVLLNVASSYASDHLTPELLRSRLETDRRRLLPEHPVLEDFQVSETGQITLSGGEDAAASTPEPIVAAVGAWIRAFFARAEHDLPGRFGLDVLVDLTEVVREDLADLGFYQALEMTPDSQETT